MKNPLKRSYSQYVEKIYNPYENKIGMIIYLLGLLDLLAGISLLLLKFGVDFYGVVFASYLMVKGLLFIKNIVSAFDIISSIIFFYSLYFGYFGILFYLAAAWLLQKGIFSFLRTF